MTTFSNNTATNRKVLYSAYLRHSGNKEKCAKILKSMNHLLKDKAVIELPTILG